jgi:hypothetical protein
MDLDVKSELYVVLRLPHNVNRIKRGKFPQQTADSVWPDILLVRTQLRYAAYRWFETIRCSRLCACVSRCFAYNLILIQIFICLPNKVQ